MFTTTIQAILPQFQRHSLRYTGYSGTHYSKKLSRLALLLANALSTSSGVGQCSRWHCSNKSASSRSSVMVERIDVSVRCNFENTRSDSHVVTGSVPRMVSSRWMFGNLTLLQLLSAAVAVSGRSSVAIAVHCLLNEKAYS
jgi:hypothetical protein